MEIDQCDKRGQKLAPDRRPSGLRIFRQCYERLHVYCPSSALVRNNHILAAVQHTKLGRSMSFRYVGKVHSEGCSVSLLI